MLCCVAPKYRRDKKKKNKAPVEEDDDGGFEESFTRTSKVSLAPLKTRSTGNIHATDIKLDLEKVPRSSRPESRPGRDGLPLSARVSYDTDIRRNEYNKENITGVYYTPRDDRASITNRNAFSVDTKVPRVNLARSLPSLIDEPEITRFPTAEKFRFHGSTTSLSNVNSVSTLSLETEGASAVYGSATQLHTQMLDRRFQLLKERAANLKRKDSEIRQRYQDLLDKRKSICSSPEANITQSYNPYTKQERRQRFSSLDSDGPVPPPRRKRATSMENGLNEAVSMVTTPRRTLTYQDATIF